MNDNEMDKEKTFSLHIVCLLITLCVFVKAISLLFSQSMNKSSKKTRILFAASSEISRSKFLLQNVQETMPWP